MPEFNGFSHIAITVSDLERSKSWYMDVLGLQPVMDGVDEESGIAYSVGFMSGGFALGLRQHPGEGGTFTPDHLGLDHASFGVASRADLDAWESHLTEKGVTQSGIVEAPYGHVLSFKDPDNIALEAFFLSM
ncbi:MAG TPA: VOC family protein [Acidimicrobiales bacterium]|nr:VOC family protein [Acidimicrobiales bacterium]